MTDELRRRDDGLLTSLDKRLALLEQSHDLRGRAEEARSKTLEKSVDALGSEVKAAIVLWQTVTAEPTASPAGRALSAKLSELEEADEKHTNGILDLRTWKDEMAGTMKALRAVVLVLGMLTSVLTIVQIVIALGGKPL